MMTISGGSRGAGAPKQTAAYVVPPTAIVPTVSVTRRACPAPSASRDGTHAFPSPGPARHAALALAVPGPARTPVGAAATSPRPASPGPDPGPALPGWNRRQATELIPS